MLTHSLTMHARTKNQSNDKIHLLLLVVFFGGSVQLGCAKTLITLTFQHVQTAASKPNS